MGAKAETGTGHTKKVLQLFVVVLYAPLGVVTSRLTAVLCTSTVGLPRLSPPGPEWRII
jgi:hypothetical protein